MNAARTVRLVLVAEYRPSHLAPATMLQVTDESQDGVDCGALSSAGRCAQLRDLFVGIRTIKAAVVTEYVVDLVLA